MSKRPESAARRPDAARQRRPTHLLGVALLLLATLLAETGHAALLAEGFGIDYNVSRNGLGLGMTRRELQPLGEGRLLFRSHTEAEGLVAVFFRDVVKERSELQIRDGRALPQVYDYVRSGGRKQRAFGLVFDWPRQELTFTETAVTAPLRQGTQDTLSFFVQVMLNLRDGKDSFEMPIASRKRVREYRVEHNGITDLQTAIGTLQTVHLKAQEVGRDTSYELWCSVAHDHLPVKVLQIKPDETIELTVRALRVGPPTAAGG